MKPWFSDLWQALEAHLEEPGSVYFPRYGVVDIEASWTDLARDPEFYTSLGEGNYAWLLRLIGGEYATVTGWHDYTGWDCQCKVQVRIFDSRDEAIRLGLTLNEREVLGLLLPGEALDG